MAWNTLLSESSSIVISGLVLLLIQAAARGFPVLVRRLRAIVSQKRAALAVWPEVREAIRSEKRLARRLGISPDEVARRFRFRNAAEFRRVTWEMKLLVRRDPSLGLDR
jgi:hypothetical protein